MKQIKFKLSIILVAILLMSCVNEIAPPATEKEIITEISRTWSCSLKEGDFPISGFLITISDDNSEEKKVFITNFHKIGTNKKVNAVVNNDLSIVIPEQTIEQQTFKGKGEISNDYSKITWDYTLENENGTIHVTGTSFRGNAL